MGADSHLESCLHHQMSVHSLLSPHNHITQAQHRHNSLSLPFTSLLVSASTTFCVDHSSLSSSLLFIQPRPLVDPPVSFNPRGNFPQPGEVSCRPVHSWSWWLRPRRGYLTSGLAHLNSTICPPTPNHLPCDHQVFLAFLSLPQSRSRQHPPENHFADCGRRCRRSSQTQWSAFLVQGSRYPTSSIAVHSSGFPPPIDA